MMSIPVSPKFGKLVALETEEKDSRQGHGFAGGRPREFICQVGNGVLMHSSGHPLNSHEIPLAQHLRDRHMHTGKYTTDQHFPYGACIPDLKEYQENPE